MKVEAYAKTDKGDVRKLNEDAFGVFNSEQFYVVADGVGGHQGGDVAAKETVEQLYFGVHRLHQLIANRDPDEVSNLLRLNVDETNKVVIKKGAAHTGLKGMASTFCFVFIFASTAYYSHFGDSRIYLYRNKTLKLLTEDDTLASKLAPEMQMHATTREKNTLTKAMGLTKDQSSKVQLLPLEPNDIFLLCSDGLVEGLTDEHLNHYLSQNKPSNELLEKIILDARNQKAKDNITAILLEVNP